VACRRRSGYGCHGTGRSAFREVGPYGTFERRPPVPLWRQSLDLIVKAYLAVRPNPDIAGRLIEHFHRAGPGQPTLFCEMPVAGGIGPVAYTWNAESVRSVMPQLKAIGVPTVEIGIDTLEDRLREVAKGLADCRGRR
jgi:hypothetical protein